MLFHSWLFFQQGWSCSAVSLLFPLFLGLSFCVMKVPLVSSLVLFLAVDASLGRAVVNLPCPSHMGGGSQRRALRSARKGEDLTLDMWEGVIGRKGAMEAFWIAQSGKGKQAAQGWA